MQGAHAVLLGCGGHGSALEASPPWPRASPRVGPMSVLAVGGPARRGRRSSGDRAPSPGGPAGRGDDVLGGLDQQAEDGYADLARVSPYAVSPGAHQDGVLSRRVAGGQAPSSLERLDSRDHPGAIGHEGQQPIVEDVDRGAQGLDVGSDPHDLGLATACATRAQWPHASQCVAVQPFGNSRSPRARLSSVHAGSVAMRVGARRSAPSVPTTPSVRIASRIGGNRRRGGRPLGPIRSRRSPRVAA